MPRSLLLSLLLGAALAAGCEAADDAGAADGGTVTGGDAGGPATDGAGTGGGGGSDTGTAPGTDDLPGAGDPGTTGPPELTVGTNVTGKNTPADFTALADGDPLRVELGFQGAYMVVLAFKAKGLPKGKVDVAASLVSGATTLGQIKLKGKTPAPGGNGFTYYYNLFVITEGFDPWLGEPATARVVVSEPGGEPIAEASVTGPLTGP
jgi:hypothetical protein